MLTGYGRGLLNVKAEDWGLVNYWSHGSNPYFAVFLEVIGPLHFSTTLHQSFI